MFRMKKEILKLLETDLEPQNLYRGIGPLISKICQLLNTITKQGLTFRWIHESDTQYCPVQGKPQKRVSYRSLMANVLFGCSITNF
jgi:hypothetical protein